MTKERDFYEKVDGIFGSIGLCTCLCWLFQPTKEDVTLSFRGEHEYFAISNGSIVLNDTEEVFDGGNLEIVQPDMFVDAVSFSYAFYTVRGEEQYIILSNSFIDQTGGAVNISGDLGKIAGADIIGREKKDIDNLWFELKTTDLNGKENTYQVQLEMTEITKNADS